jgi:putative RNA 2'-phosphotransferase
MDRRTATRLSKFLSLVLRHRPDEYGLRMDSLGYVDFEDLVDVLVAEDILAEDAEEQVLGLVEGSERRRFEVVDGRIRALYGHSARVNLDLPPEDPPETLYHGTTIDTARRIAEEGLRPAGRAYVHLSSTREEALSVGRRHADDPVLLEVDTAAAREAGATFHRATDLIWLCPALPVEVLRIPELPESRPPAAPPAPARPAARPTSDPGGTDRPPTGVRIIEAESGGEFKRRTRKKGTRR